MSEQEPYPRFYVHKTIEQWIIVRMGDSHVIFSPTMSSAPAWQEWHSWHEKNVKDGYWVEITYADMRPPKPTSPTPVKPRRSLQQVRLYLPTHDRVGWMMARLGDKFMMLSEWTSEFQLKDWTTNEDRQVELGAFLEIPYPNLRPTREVDDLRAEVKEKVRLIEDLRAEMDSESLNVQTLEAKLKHSQQKLDEAEKTIKSLNQGWMDRDNLIDGLQKQVDSLTANNTALGEELARVTSDRNYLRDKTAEKEQTIQELGKDLDRSLKSLREDLKGRDDTIALLNKKVVEQADQIRTMQSLAGAPWSYVDSLPKTDIAGNPVVWSTNGPVAQMKTNESLKFTPIPANEVDMVDLRELQRQVTDLIIRFDQFRQYSISRETRLAARVEKLEEKFRDNTLETPYVCKDGKIVRSEDGID
ncbi:MAG: hypothetical protein E6R03_15760 [Hyphomicrobiaceae bacterium]|nr:MAG: hypothetical protein E6R03_15760 [Hyphomicrobiaceae bacterium]